MYKRQKHAQLKELKQVRVHVPLYLGRQRGSRVRPVCLCCRPPFRAPSLLPQKAAVSQLSPKATNPRQFPYKIAYKIPIHLAVSVFVKGKTFRDLASGLMGAWGKRLGQNLYHQASTKMCASQMYGNFVWELARIIIDISALLSKIPQPRRVNASRREMEQVYGL